MTGAARVASGKALAPAATHLSADVNSEVPYGRRQRPVQRPGSSEIGERP